MRKLKTTKSTDKFNPSMLVLARETRGLSQSDLAEMILITQGKLSKIESGIMPVSSSELSTISQKLNYPEDFFFQYDRVYGPGVTDLFHRKRQTLSTKLLKKYHAIMQLRQMQLERLLRSADIGAININPVDIDDPESPTPEEVAQMTRASWNLPTGPIENVISVIEDAGGIVIPCDFETTKIDAMSRWIPGMPPIFFINTCMPMDRIRFTLCHELGHVIMHRLPNANVEQQADAFASEFLMPKRDILSLLDNLSIEKLATIKKLYKVSMAAIVYRAKKLNKITENQARYLFVQLSALGYKTKEPDWLEPPREQPKLYYELVRVHLEDFHYSEAELSKILFLYETEFRECFKPEIRRLKIVR